MEKLVNCHIVIDIESIEKISGGNQYYEVLFLSTDKISYKMIFDFVWDIRCSIESAYIDRMSRFYHNEEKKSNIFLIQNSDSVRDFKKQASGTRPTEELNNYIMFDRVDTIIEVLTIKEPMLIKLWANDNVYKITLILREFLPHNIWLIAGETW